MGCCVLVREEFGFSEEFDGDSDAKRWNSLELNGMNSSASIVVFDTKGAGQAVVQDEGDLPLNVSDKTCVE